MTVDDFSAQLERIFAAQEDLTSKWHIDDGDGGGGYEGVMSSPESYALDSIAAIQHFMNYSLWHVEDTARRRDVPPSVTADCKHRIDALNQKRNNLIEKMDGAIIESISRRLPPDAAGKCNTETMGMAIDRMSILALKIYHMREQAERSGAGAEHIAKCARSLAQLTEQRETLSRSILDLAEDFFAGRKSVKPYYQHKMYNDKTLNPELYGRVTKGDVVIMKEIKFFMMETCPHCKKAAAMMDALFAAHPEYRSVPLERIDETKRPDYAAKFDYYYVPTFYVDGEKLHEGVPSEEAIESVFKAAYAK